MPRATELRSAETRQVYLQLRKLVDRSGPYASCLGASRRPPVGARGCRRPRNLHKTRRSRRQIVRSVVFRCYARSRSGRWLRTDATTATFTCINVWCAFARDRAARPPKLREKNQMACPARLYTLGQSATRHRHNQPVLISLRSCEQDMGAMWCSVRWTGLCSV